MRGSGAERRRALRARLGADRGQTATEYLGMIVVVAGIITVLVVAAPAIAGLIEQGVRAAICPLTEKGCGPAGSNAGNPLTPDGALPPGQALPPGAGVHGVDPTTTQADPVNSLTGAFETEITDARLPGPGEPFALVRSYTSENADEAGPLGPGWTHAYAARLEILPNDVVELHAGDGQVVRYSRQGDTYLAHPSIRSELRPRGPGYELLTREQLRYRFDSAGRLQEIIDRNDNSQSLSYDDEGRLAELTDTAGRKVAFQNEGERLRAVRLPDGREVSYAYEDGRLSKVTDLRGGETRYAYDGDDQLRSITDQLGVRLVQNTYTEGGRVAEQVDARGNKTTFEWDEDSRVQTMTDARGGEWKDTYDQVGRLLRQSNPLGETVAYEWDEAFRVTEIVDPRNYHWELGYDDDHNLTRIRAPDPLGYSERYRYNELNDPTSYTDPAGNAWRLRYDERGNLTEAVAPDGAATSVDVDERGLPTAIADPLGRATAVDYDREGNPTRVTNPAGDVARFAYDDAGRPVVATDPRAPRPGAAKWSWRLAWNEADQLVSGSDPLGNTTRIGYDAAGRMVEATDAKDRTAQWAYDPQGNLVAVTPPGGGPTVYAYDPANDLAAITDPEGNPTQYLRDAAGRVTAAIGPSGEVATARYDRGGNLTEIVDPNGNATPGPGDGTTRIDYDAIGRATAVDFSDEDTPDLALEWDARSLLSEIRDGEGAERRSYDSVGRLTAVRRGDDPFRYAFDAAGQLTTRTYPDGTAQRYAYDEAGRLAEASGPEGTTAYAYDAASNLTRALYPNGVTEARTYDPAARLTGITARAGGKLIARSLYTLDPTANPTRVETESGAVSYAYDERDRLVSACYAESCDAEGAERESFAYDEIGNLTERTSLEGTTSFDYDAASRLTEVRTPDGDLDYEHDANGNVTRAGERSFSYDQLNRITTATVGEGEVSYAYEAFLRASASGPEGNTTYSWDKSFALPQLASERGPSGKTTYSYGAGRVSQSGPEGTLFFHPDALGSTRALTTAKGALADRTAYRPYGEQRSGEQAPPTRQRFTGELQEEETGLYYLRARDYDPASGRFLQPDPLIPGVGQPWRSVYSYVGGRPTAFTDPSGELGPLAVVGGLALLGGGGGAGVHAIASDDDSFEGYAGAFAGGAFAGGLSAVSGPLGGTIARGLFGAATSTGGRAVASTAGVNLLAGAGGTTLNSIISRGDFPTPLQALTGGVLNVGGGLLAGRLFPSQGINTLSQFQHFAPRSLGGLLNLTQVNSRALLGGSLTDLALNLGSSVALAGTPLGQVLAPLGQFAPDQILGGLGVLGPLGQSQTK